MSAVEAITALLIDPPRCASDHTWNNAIRMARTVAQAVEDGGLGSAQVEHGAGENP